MGLTRLVRVEAQRVPPAIDVLQEKSVYRYKKYTRGVMGGSAKVQVVDRLATMRLLPN